jgi:hypothetical protein
MRKTKLTVDYTIDFELIGIASLLKPFTLAWQLNQALGWHLVRQPDHQAPNKSKELCLYSFFEYQTQLSTVRLFKNKPNDPIPSKWVLVPEYPKFDFILMLQSDDNQVGKRLQQLIKNIPSVELVASLPLAALKSKDTFIF